MFYLKVIGLILYAIPSPLALFLSSLIWGASDFNLNNFEKAPLIILSCIFWPSFLSFAFIRGKLFGNFNTNFLT